MRENKHLRALRRRAFGVTVRRWILPALVVHACTSCASGGRLRLGATWVPPTFILANPGSTT